MSGRESVPEKEKKITILRTCLKFLQLLFCWPKTSDELSPGIGYKIKALINMTYPLIYGVTTLILHIIHVKTNHFDVNLDEDFAIILSLTTLYLVAFEFFLKQQQFARLLLQLCDYKFERPKDLDRIENLLSWLTKAFFCLVVLGVTTYGLVPLIEQSKCEEYFKKKNIDELCGYFMPTTSSMVPKYDLFIFKRMVFLIQGFCTFMNLIPTAMICLLAFGINVHLAVHIKNLRRQVNALAKSRDVKKELYNLVKYHQYIMEIMNSMNSCFYRGLSVHVFLTSSIIGCILHQIVNLTWSTPVGPVMHLTCWIIALLLNSLGGELILNESIAVGTDLYFSDWLDFDQSLKKDLLFIIMRTQKPIVLKAGFGVMSLGVFTTVLKALHTLTFTLFRGQ